MSASWLDERKLAFNPAVEVSYLKRDEQRMLLEAMDAEQTTPSLSQAQRLKKFSQEGRLTEEAMSAIMSEEKKSDMDKVTLRSDTLRRYFPKSYTPKQMEQTIIKLLDVWQKQRQKWFQALPAVSLRHDTRPARLKLPARVFRDRSAPDCVYKSRNPSIARE